jgi:hypothetical protein
VASSFTGEPLPISQPMREPQSSTRIARLGPRRRPCRNVLSTKADFHTLSLERCFANVCRGINIAVALPARRYAVGPEAVETRAITGPRGLLAQQTRWIFAPDSLVSY